MKTCTICKEEKPLEKFAIQKRVKSGRDSWCKDCKSKWSKQYRLNNPDKFKDKKNDINYQFSYKHKGYDRNDALEILKQQGGCMICKIELPEEGRKWFLDHDHSCCPKNTSCDKCRRGILCRDCNLMLGFAKDNLKTLQNAIKYLLEHRDKVEEIDANIRAASG